MRRASALLIVLGVCGALLLPPSRRCPGAASRDELRSAVGGCYGGTFTCHPTTNGCDGTFQCWKTGIAEWTLFTSTGGIREYCCEAPLDGTGYSECAWDNSHPCRWSQTCSLSGCNSCSDPVEVVSFPVEAYITGDPCQGEAEGECMCAEP